jgi:hypothetical protein
MIEQKTKSIFILQATANKTEKNKKKFHRGQREEKRLLE